MAMTEINIEHSHEKDAVSEYLDTQTESEFSQWGKKLERLAQEGVKKEIAAHKASGRSIFYSREGVSIVEHPDGRCFEYRVLKDRTEKIVREV
jgi:hypothetical protein